MCDKPREAARKTSEATPAGRVSCLHTAAVQPPPQPALAAAGSSKAWLFKPQGGSVPTLVAGAAAAAVLAATVAAASMSRQDGASTPSASTSAPSASGSAETYDGLTFVSHMIAGSVAGTVEHTAMYPVDTIKTRMQALYHPGHAGHAVSRASLRQALRAILQQEGVPGLYRGVAAVAAGAGPAHALHFAVYEAAKESLGGNRQGLHPLETATAGCVATVVNDALMTPVDSVKQRCQVEGSPYRGVLDAARSMLRHEGIGSFFRSYRTTLVMNVPYTAMHFSVYETAKKLILRADESEEETLRVQLVAGGMAGGAAAAVTTPLDVVKTRLQTTALHSGTDGSAPKYASGAVLPALRQIVREEGMQALWTGLAPRVLFHIPAAAVCWGTYESVKSLLGAQQHHDR